MALALSLGLRCASQELQQNWVALLGRVLRRQHLGVHAALACWRARAPHAALSPDEAEEAAAEVAGARCWCGRRPAQGPRDHAGHDVLPQRLPDRLDTRRSFQGPCVSVPSAYTGLSFTATSQLGSRH